MAVTGWAHLEPGSLNLRVPSGVLEALMNLTPAWLEDGSTVVYPALFSHIPRRRAAYLYFLGTARTGAKSHQVLVRRAQNPVPEIVELFAPLKLRKFFGLVSGDQIAVDMHTS